ncbi:MAG: putative addiction module antidote protein [Candidatus Cloacimonetes bacterium]|nr:putative addiction module antidote protein [Candidatus Cloacimonadota bacterium]
MNKKMEFSEFDPLEILNTEERLIAYLNAELAEGDPYYIRLALNTIARARDISEIAQKAGISQETILNALSTEGNPEYSTIQKIFNALDIRLMVVKENNYETI